jgi:hypothetical protein
MPPALVIGISPEASRKSRPFANIAAWPIALRAGRAGTAAGARVRAVPWSVQVVLANPTAVIADSAAHDTILYFFAGFRRGSPSLSGFPACSACVRAICANIIGPRFSAADSKHSIAVCHSLAFYFAFGRLWM